MASGWCGVGGGWSEEGQMQAHRIESEGVGSARFDSGSLHRCVVTDLALHAPPPGEGVGSARFDSVPASLPQLCPAPVPRLPCPRLLRLHAEADKRQQPVRGCAEPVRRSWLVKAGERPQAD